jgi:UDP-N-acetylmuramoyl-tripeptide--D-alanyl-D-alanine ligase
MGLFRQFLRFYESQDTISDNLPIKNIVTDTRHLKPGDFFIALKGLHFDGHDFVHDAFQLGAVGAMVNQDYPLQKTNLLRVKDTYLGLGMIAKKWRNLHAIPVIGITGSSGKTTTKEMLVSILRLYKGEQAVLATQGNFNNHIGLPLTLLQLNHTHRYAIVEMGMNHAQEIAYLTRLAKPTVAVLLNASYAHMEGGFASLADIARAKSEIFEGLTEKGVAIINAEDAHEAFFKEKANGHPIITFGLKTGDIRSENQVLHAQQSIFDVVTPNGRFSVTLKTPGVQNIKNALAAVAVSYALHVPISVVASGFLAFSAVHGRLNYLHLASGALLIDDTYNANPDSMKAAIDALMLAKAPHILIMGDMLELGVHAKKLHEEVGRYARLKGVTQLLTLGDLSSRAAYTFGRNAQSFEVMQDLLDQVNMLQNNKGTILVKGSRLMKMEQVIQQLTGHMTS